MSDIYSVGYNDFTKEVLDSNLPVVVDFWAEWCGPCKMFTAVVEAIAQIYQGKIKVVQVNVDEEPELSEKFEVMTIPTLALIVGGKTVDTLMGAYPRHKVEEWLKQHGID